MDLWMSYQEDLLSLVTDIRKYYKDNKKKNITKKEIAERLDLKESTFYNLLGGHDPVTEVHILLVKERFKKELGLLRVDNLRTVKNPIKSIHRSVKRLEKKQDLLIALVTLLVKGEHLTPDNQQKIADWLRGEIKNSDMNKLIAEVTHSSSPPQEPR
jgi:hypothetical protein